MLIQPPRVWSLVDDVDSSLALLNPADGTARRLGVLPFGRQGWVVGLAPTPEGLAIVVENRTAGGLWVGVATPQNLTATVLPQAGRLLGMAWHDGVLEIASAHGSLEKLNEMLAPPVVYRLDPDGVHSHALASVHHALPLGAWLSRRDGQWHYLANCPDFQHGRLCDVQPGGRLRALGDLTLRVDMLAAGVLGDPFGMDSVFDATTESVRPPPIRADEYFRLEDYQVGPDATLLPLPIQIGPNSGYIFPWGKRRIAYKDGLVAVPGQDDSRPVEIDAGGSFGLGRLAFVPRDAHSAWLIGADGQYLTLDDTLQRLDPVPFFEHLRRRGRGYDWNEPQHAVFFVFVVGVAPLAVLILTAIGWRSTKRRLLWGCLALGTTLLAAAAFVDVCAVLP